ncbi:uncharacterized protein LTR77_008176 [Saxophila tyrrhenica]|uniref:Uncharacterized protein n=1 Tax=Saxophila tyrrhenica TaxID=1690608 RepID=A0AAV9P209_9PEZI|nr:hypothetical protein LTR77_008176 [Saxophila tyrrhenica]
MAGMEKKKDGGGFGEGGGYVVADYSGVGGYGVEVNGGGAAVYGGGGFPQYRAGAGAGVGGSFGGGNQVFCFPAMYNSAPKQASLKGLGSGIADIGQQLSQAVKPQDGQHVGQQVKPQVDQQVGEQGVPVSMWSMRSGCSENDDFYFPTPAQAAREKYLARKAEEKRKRSPEEKRQASFEKHQKRISDEEKKKQKNKSSANNVVTNSVTNFKQHAVATQQAPLLQATAAQAGTRVQSENTSKDNAAFYQQYVKTLIVNHVTELTEKECQLMSAQQAMTAKNKAIEELSARMSMLEQHVLSQQAHISMMQTPQTIVYHPAPVYGHTPSTIGPNESVSVARVNHSRLEQQAQQYQRPTSRTPDTADDTASASHRTPSSDLTKVSPSTNPFLTKPHSCDDVFGGTSPPTVALTPGAWSPAAEFAKKPLPELLSSCFKKVEASLHALPIEPILPNHGHRLSGPEFEIWKLAQEHLQNNRMASIQMETHEERYWLMLGMLSQEVVKQIFNDSILGHFPGRHAQEFVQLWAEEQDLRRPQNPRCIDLMHRHKLAETRVDLANTIVKMPGFWKWVQTFAADKTDAIISIYAPAFQRNHLNTLHARLHKAVVEATKIAIRMRQEPMIFEIFFPRHGIGWGSKFMVHRNKELVGQEISDEKCPYVVRCTALPLVKYKWFGENTADPVVLHKAEGTVGDRKTNLRPNKQRVRQ